MGNWHVALQLPCVPSLLLLVANSLLANARQVLQTWLLRAFPTEKQLPEWTKTVKLQSKQLNNEQNAIVQLREAADSDN